jgi:creatinine deaminase
MCSGAILLYGIPRVVIGENGTFVGEEDLLRSRGVQVVVLGDARCQKLMGDFIKEHPEVCTPHSWPAIRYPYSCSGRVVRHM